MKPSNLLITNRTSGPVGDWESVDLSRLTVKIAGFSHSTSFDTDAEWHGMTRTVTGTPAYWAPEVLLERYDSKVDIYPLGIIAFNLLNKRTPTEQEGKN